VKNKNALTKLINVENEEQFKSWHKIYTKVFYKKEDQFSPEFIWNWMQKPSETIHKLLLIQYKDKYIGFIWQMLNKPIKTAYYYYLGLLKQYRGKGIFTEVEKLNEKFLLKEGIEVILAEPENPQYIKDSIEFADANRRIRFYKEKIGFYIITDTEITYLRHCPPNKLDTIQNSYLLAFKPLREVVRIKFITSGKLRKTAYRQMYLNQTRIELGIKSEEELVLKSKPARQFLKDLDALKIDTVALM